MDHKKREGIDFRELGYGNRAKDPFNVNSGTIEEYVQEKIVDIAIMNKEIADLEAALADKKRIRDTRVAEEVHYLRKKIGVNNLQAKVKGLSEMANNNLIEE